MSPMLHISFSWKYIAMAMLGICVFVGIFFAALFFYQKQYEDRVLPGVHIGDVAVGGMNEQELRDFMLAMHEKLMESDIMVDFRFGEQTKTFSIAPSFANEDFLIELVRLDPDLEAAAILSYKKDGSWPVRAWSAFATRMAKPRVPLRYVAIDTIRLFEQIDAAIAPYTQSAKNASVRIASVSPLVYEITAPSAGTTFSYPDVTAQLTAAWSELSLPRLSIVSEHMNPAILEDDVRRVEARLPAVFDDKGLTITFVDPHTKQKRTWELPAQKLAEWIEVQKAGDAFGFGLSQLLAEAYIVDTIAKEVTVEAQDARFAIGQNGKVTEFVGSRPGIRVDATKTYQALNNAFLQRTWHDEGVVTTVALNTEQTEPSIKTGEVNDLGITEVLGVGHSRFVGSSALRIKNIRHGVVDKLHGLLIKPDEEFSLVQALKPFTLADGYVPEKVIIGNKIEKQVGGGLCQIGTTMFRAAMNSGLEITERRNHGLVVSYYNDLENGLPGTDATIYDPAPDFRFKNDTGNAILITVDIRETTNDLFITLWGTSDGRKGYYTKPVLHKWIPHGETQYIQTTTLKPGQEECQSAYTGAEASFTYIRELPNGETLNHVFESKYRAVPKICLIGVEAAPACPVLLDGTSACASQTGAASEPPVDATASPSVNIPPPNPEEILGEG